ncbi:tripartite motif-containing protein 5-like isoform X4 [Loxodonta africana]|uniref:tripartite motif-containing protein 5-like isoform X4 n=1 Tax=Loxodonta africana TaxID=9785 RepID=UPI0030CB79A6
MASAIVVKLQEEVTCPICLELLREPLSLDCGHSFCQACITVNSKTSMVSSEGESTCPMCRIKYQADNLRPNQHLANIVEKLREVKVSLEEKGQTGDVCERHGEKLLLFCKEDGKVICWLCERTEEHRGHRTFLVEEVAQKNQAKLKAALERLRMKQKKAEKLGADIREERASWKNQIETERQNVQAQFNQLRDILDSEEQCELQKLQKEEENIMDKLAKGEKELAQQSQWAEELVSDLEHRLQASSVEMLQGVNDIIKRSETFTVKRPKTFPKKPRRTFQAPDLRDILQMFREPTDTQYYGVSLTLRPVMPNANVMITDDWRQVRSVLYWMPFESFNIGIYDNYGVLGFQYMESGKHYWEVDVSNKTEWILGVCFRDCRTRATYAHHQTLYSSYSPQCGFWVVWLQNGSMYNTFKNSSLNNPSILTLSLTVPPNHVGIFLDYEAGSLSFFNVTNHGFLIYKFSKCRFPKPTCPYFNPMKCTLPMSLCLPDS